MNKILKPIFIFLLVAILLASFCISAFAATASYKVIAGAYSQELADLTCNYKSIKKDNFTITNNGTITLIVHVNGCLWKEVRPGQSFSYKLTHSFKDRVQVFAKTRAAGQYQKFTIKSTSGVIYNN